MLTFRTRKSKKNKNLPLCTARASKEVRLPKTLHTIRVEAFINCAALPELALPPSLKHSESFLGLHCLQEASQVARHKWQGIFAEESAFAICPDMRWPPWLHMIPDTGYISGSA